MKSPASATGLTGAIRSRARCRRPPVGRTCLHRQIASSGLRFRTGIRAWDSDSLFFSEAGLGHQVRQRLLGLGKAGLDLICKVSPGSASPWPSPASGPASPTATGRQPPGPQSLPAEKPWFQGHPAVCRGLSWARHPSLPHRCQPVGAAPPP